ncbi:MAG: hypothetical protein Q4Q17_05675, partial [Tissierellia bacterium]|nr:hypothetical protein [Tissierellia bacterium]
SLSFTLKDTLCYPVIIKGVKFSVSAGQQLSFALWNSRISILEETYNSVKTKQATLTIRVGNHKTVKDLMKKYDIEDHEAFFREDNGLSFEEALLDRNLYIVRPSKCFRFIEK